MKAAAQQRRGTAPSQRFVIPVRYVARGEVMQTTSTALTPRAVHLRSVEPPNPGLIVGLKLYSPGSREVLLRSATVVGVTQDKTPGFWAQFSDDPQGSDRITRLLAQHREMGDRGCARAETRMPVTLRPDGRPEAKGVIANLSRSGAFIEGTPNAEVGSIVGLDLALPDGQPEARVLALVVHGDGGGIGVQFVGGNDAFRSRLDQHLASLTE